MKETELAQKFIEYLSCYDLYFEVNGVDIVAVNKPLLIAYEVKLSLNFKVIEQAFNNQQYYHYSYVCAPLHKDDYMQLRICEMLGIGVLTYQVYSSRLNLYEIRERIRPKLNRKALTQHVHLRDFQKRSIAGSPAGHQVITPFKLTVEALTKYVHRQPGCLVKTAITNIKHHYGSDSTAVSCVYEYIRNNIITSVKLEGGKLYPKKIQRTK